MKYFLIVGEKSGDLHASKVMRELKKLDHEADFKYFGGDLMQREGGELLKHHKDLAFLGIWDVLLNLRKIFSYIKECKEAIKSYQPDVVLGVDYSSFNLKIAKWAFESGFLYYHYIAPKTWAWKEKRVHKIKKYVDKMFCIFPFEEEYFAKFDLKVDYTGHPVVDAVEEHVVNRKFIQDNDLNEKPIIALFPGSRKQEIERMLEFMVGVSSSFDSYQFVIGAVSNYPKQYYEKIKSQYKVEVVYNQTYDLLANSKAAITKSGTVTLETALFNVPQVTIYLTNRLNYIIFKAILPKRLNYVTPVNLIANKEVIKELLYKHETTHQRLKEELNNILEVSREQMLMDYQEVESFLNKQGASKRTAQLIHQYLNKKQ